MQPRPHVCLRLAGERSPAAPLPPPRHPAARPAARGHRGGWAEGAWLRGCAAGDTLLPTRLALPRRCWVFQKEPGSGAELRAVPAPSCGERSPAFWSWPLAGSLPLAWPAAGRGRGRGHDVLLQCWHCPLLCLAVCRQPPSSRSLLLSRLREPSRYNGAVLVSLCLRQKLINPLASAAQIYCLVFFSLHLCGCPGSGVPTHWPWWSLLNLLSLHSASEYLQLLCWSIPKEILYITGINQVKYQLFLHQKKKKLKKECSLLSRE